MQWLYSIWRWIILHYKEIITFLTSSSTVAVITSIISNHKRSKNIDNNTLAIQDMTDTTKELLDLKSMLQKTVTSFNSLMSDTTLLKSENELLKEQLSDVKNVLNNFAEMYKLVYSNLKDENIRNAVSSILINTTYGDVIEKADLEKQVAELTKQLDEATTKIKDEAVKKLEDTLSKETKSNKKTKTSRY